jgi:hypothetical protein
VSESALQANITKIVFAHAIPAIWSLSGYASGTVDLLGDYLSTDTMMTT